MLYQEAQPVLKIAQLRLPPQPRPVQLPGVVADSHGSRQSLWHRASVRQCLQSTTPGRGTGRSDGTCANPG